ncbi:MAG: DegT/DnrJ/EryC1/StrS family aminotransferase, partial [Nanoarchaeota archaeon]|nr:DegT/DnrJ/EryC1/StrS family aminotransferase [Nanoarchaeota archaeon]
IDPNTWLMNKIPEFVLRDSPDAVVIVDIFGNLAEFQTDLPLLVDAAHSYSLKGLGKRGKCEVISFSFTKLITGMQGGCLLTDDYNVYTKAWELIHLSAKMLEIEAYYILKQIDTYEEQVIIRNKLINMYRQQIKIPFVEQRIPVENNFSVYAIMFEDKKIRDKVAQKFSDNGVEVKIYYQPLVDNLPNTTNVFDRILSLPLYSKLVENDIEYICNLINSI